MLSLKAFPHFPLSNTEYQQHPGAVTHNASLNALLINTDSPNDSMWSWDQFDSSWTGRFQRLYSEGKVSLLIRDTEYLTDDLERLLAPDTSTHELSWAWEQLGRISEHISKHPSTRLWEDVMLWTLRNNPERAIELLLITKRYSQVRMSRYKIADCLDYLGLHYLNSHEGSDARIIHPLRELTYDLLLAKDHDISGNLYLPDTIANLLFLRGDSHSFLRDLSQSPVALYPNTVLHFLDISIGWGDLPLSLHLLRSVVNSGLSIDEPQMQSACVKLLRIRSDPGHQHKIRMNVLTELLEMGIRPRLALCNAMLLTIIESEDHELAWRMFELGKANGLAPDAVTYGLMLKNAKMGQDFDMLSDVLREIESKPSILQDEPRLLSDVLNSIYHRGLEMELPPFPEMLRLYTKFCETKPLEELGIYKSKAESPVETSIRKLPPTPHILGQVIGAYLMCNQKTNRIFRVYNQYRQLVDSGHALISPIAEDDYVANGFMLAFGTRASTLRYCTMVVKQMLDAAHQSQVRKGQIPIAAGASLLADVHASTGFYGQHTSPKRIPKAPRGLGSASLRRNSREQSPPTVSRKQSPPTVRTWTLLARAFLQHRQQIAAEKVLKLMQEHRVRPTDVTWNTFVSGYADMQNVEAAVGTVNRMQAEQLEITTKSIGALSRMWDRARLLKALEQSEETSVEQHRPSWDSLDEDTETAVVGD